MDIKMDELRKAEKELEIPLDELLDAVEDALMHAYLRRSGAIRGARVVFDRETGEAQVLAPEVDEDGSVIGEFDDTPKDFGRIATATARSIIVQRINDAKTNRILGPFKDKLNEIVSGTVQYDSYQTTGDVKILIGDYEALLRSEEQLPGERLAHNDIVRALVIEASAGQRGAIIRLSRSHPDFVRKLFEREVPEIETGVVEIVALSREAGHRSKVAVWTAEPDINAKGACIGHNGQRVRAVMSEIAGEKIDIVDYDDDIATFIASALSPAHVIRVDILDRDRRMARAIVPDKEASLAIGKEAQNVRLAAKLTGWSIDIRKESEDPEAN